MLSFRGTRVIRTSAPYVLLVIAAALPVAASAQALERAAFVANNGNLEGSVTSYAFDADGGPIFLSKKIIGQKANINDPELGTNAYSIDITPNGRFIATSHATASNTVEQITVMEIGPDASVSILGEYLTPDSPLDLKWIDDRFMAVTRTSLSGTNEVIAYEFDAITDPEFPTLTEVDRKPGGSFTSHLAMNRPLRVLYAADSNSYWIRSYAVDATGHLTLLQTQPTGSTYPLGPGVSPDGTKLYAGGGISSGRVAILGFHINAADGTLSPMAGSPFTSPGNSPKSAVVSNDGKYLFVAHGTDATVRSFAIDDETGALTYTGSSFDVGLQGSQGGTAMLDDMVLFTDNTTAIDGVQGLYSFDIQIDGSFTQNGALVNSQGVAPTEIAAWSPPANCPGDLDDDGVVGTSDLALMLSAFGTCTGDPHYVPAADFDGDDCVSLVDLTQFLPLFGTVCG